MPTPSGRSEAERELSRTDEWLDAFWADFVRRPVPGGAPGRQFVQRPTDPHPFWVTRDSDPEVAERVSLNVHLGNLDFENAVEIPALTLCVPIPEELSTEPLLVLEAIKERREELKLPEPHYTLVAPEEEEIWLFWRIRPLHRPAKTANPKCHQAWKKLRFSWRMAQLKLCLAFSGLGAVPGPGLYEPLFPVPHPFARGAFLGLPNTYIAEAEPRLETLYVEDVSKPLDAKYDKLAFTELRPHFQRQPLSWLRKGAWLQSPAFLEANKPKDVGKRHPAAVTQACILRWAGFSKAEIIQHLRVWLKTCPTLDFWDRELVLIADWADRVLIPGGPRKASKRGRYQKRREVISALVHFLARRDAQTTPYEATQGELCRLATLETGVCVSKSTLQKLLSELEQEGIIERRVQRRGRASTTLWILRRVPDLPQGENEDLEEEALPSALPWRPPEIPPSEQLPLLRNGASELEIAVRTKRQKGMGLGGPSWGNKHPPGDIPKPHAPLPTKKTKFNAERPEQEYTESASHNEEATSSEAVSPSAADFDLGPSAPAASGRAPTAGDRGTGGPSTTEEASKHRRRDDEREKPRGPSSEVARADEDNQPAEGASKHRGDAARSKRPRSFEAPAHGELPQGAEPQGQPPEPAAPAAAPGDEPAGPKGHRFEEATEEAPSPREPENGLEPGQVDIIRITSTEGAGDDLGGAWNQATAIDPQKRAQTEHLCRLGFSLILLKEGKKEPLARVWKPAQFTKAPASALLLQMEDHPGANLAVVTGEISGICVVDLDTEQALAWAKEHLPPTPLVVKTARGEHWYYRLEGQARTMDPDLGPDIKINVKADGGYVVAPGSLHPSGVTYEPTETWTEELFANAPLFDPGWFPSPLKKPAQKPSDVLARGDEEDEEAYGRRVLKEMNQAMREGKFKRVRELAQLLKSDEGEG